MQAQVKEWGNSQGIRLPKEVLKSAGVTLNEFLDVTVSNGVITLVKPFRHKTKASDMPFTMYMSAQPLPIGTSGMGIDVTKITLLL